jgi:ribonucleoside-diphosphate reductase alpha chain
MVECDPESFGVQVGQADNGRPHPFECWAVGTEQPRAIGAVAKTLSADMRAQDRAWLQLKLQALMAVTDGRDITLPFPGQPVRCSSASAALAAVVGYRIRQLGVESPAEGEPTPLIDALYSAMEPASGPEGTLSWTVDVENPNSKDFFTIFVKEAMTEDGGRLPIAVRLAGRYPADLDGLCELLSLDMRIVDVAWIGMKLAKLTDYQEAMGSFIARVPGTAASEMQPSVVAYMAKLLLYRYQQLGLLTAEGKSVRPLGVMVHVPGDPENVVRLAA